MKIQKKLMLFVCFVLLPSMALLAQEYNYIGASRCKMCHNKTLTGAQYKVWAAGKHAGAMNLLKGDEKTNPDCIKCHSTYGSIADKGLIATLTPDEGVSCESCHGPGSVYKSSSIMRNRTKAIANGLIMPTEDVCKKCHNKESKYYKEFNFAEFSKKIAHPIPPKE